MSDGDLSDVLDSDIAGIPCLDSSEEEDPVLDRDITLHSNQIPEGEVFKEEPLVTYGLRGSCVLNKLNTFHAAVSFGPDMMHDFLGLLFLASELVP